MQDLKGKVALVTGGGQGLGEAISRTLAAAGLTVVVADMREDTAAKVAKSIQSKGGQALSVVLDVTDEQQAQEVVQQIKTKYGRLDVLVNNAGIDKTVSVDEMSVADFDKVMAVNLRGPFVMSKLAFELMRDQQSGHIVNITSTAAKRAWPNATAYHASKWGLLGLSHALHTEGRPLGIKVTAVVNGGMRTPFILDRFPETPLDVLQDPKNVADTVLYVLQMPAESVISEVMVLPMRETSWP
ncbi:MAG TPA: SDR family oxidoreductase [Chloroflexia bacterium]|nr:SDR family oxidoreductase [Chloroflexia bacterium]